MYIIEAYYKNFKSDIPFKVLYLTDNKDTAQQILQSYQKSMPQFHWKLLWLEN